MILAIESSCDDTGAAVLLGKRVLSNEVAGQAVHEQYGGVVPELASRAHQANIVPVVDSAIKKAGIAKEDIDAIAVTLGPGLMGSLLVGNAFAKSFALGSGIPIIHVDHMRAHILAHFIEDGSGSPQFPFLCLTVSGGHTQIILVKDHLEMEIVGSTLDDAAGEAFDKAAKILGLGYPGGPQIDRLAQKGDPEKFQFTKPRIDGLDMSFSGLKSSFLYLVQKEMKSDPEFLTRDLENVCASFQKTVVEYLMEKLTKAADQFNITQIAVAGGVSANSELRSTLGSVASENAWKVFIPKFEYCTDNAAMIGIAAQFMYSKGHFGKLSEQPDPRLTFNHL